MANPLISRCKSSRSANQFFASYYWRAATPKSGTAAWYLARLRKDHAALAVQIDAGELSVYRASIAAGLRKEPKKAAKWTKPDIYMKPVAITA